MLKKRLFYQHTPYWLLSFSVLTGLTLPSLLRDGMFMDAMLYTSVSHNLSIGIGSFWFPQFSLHNMAGLSSFHEQPPLVFGIQSVFFNLLGNSMYVERFYTFLTICLTAALINLLWKEVFSHDEPLKKMGWLPLFFWIGTRVTAWSYSNNMHENTMGIFTLCSVLLVFRALKAERFKTMLFIFAGIFVFLATFSKGFPGFFPIAAPFAYFIAIKEFSFKKMLVNSLTVLCVPLVIYAVLFVLPESKESLSIYLFKRAFQRISDAPTIDNRFFILISLIRELLPQIIIVVLVLVVARIKKTKIRLSEYSRHSFFFILVGLFASLPLMLTLVQRRFYLVPSFPFFAIGFSILIAPVILALIEKINDEKKIKLLSITSVSILLMTLFFALREQGKINPEQKETLTDVYLIGKKVPGFSTITVPSELWNDWDLQCYLIRYFNVSLDPDKQHEFYLMNKSKALSLNNYRHVNIPTLKYDLYKREL